MIRFIDGITSFDRLMHEKYPELKVIDIMKGGLLDEVVPNLESGTLETLSQRLHHH